MPDRFWDAAYRTALYDRLTPSLYGASLSSAAAAMIATRPVQVLDVGCGSGQLLESLAPWLRESGARYVGADRSLAGLRACENRAERLGVGPQCRVVQADMTDPSIVMDALGSERFDGAMLHFVTYTIRQPAQRRALLDAVRSRLLVGGRLVCCVPSRQYACRDICRQSGTRRVLQAVHRVIGLGRVERAIRRGRYLAYTADELRDELETANFAVTAIEPTYGGNGWQAIAVAREAACGEAGAL